MDNALSVLPNAGSTEGNRTRDKVHEATNKEITEISRCAGRSLSKVRANSQVP